MIAAIIVIFWLLNKNRNQPIPSKTEEILHQIAKETVFYFPSLVGEKIFYFNNQRQPGLFVYNLKTNQTEQLVQYDNLTGVKFSPDGSKALWTVEQDKNLLNKKLSPFLKNEIDDGIISTWIYDFDQRSLINLDQGVSSVVWSNDGNKIFYRFWDANERINYLSSADSQGKNWQKIVDIDFYGDYVIYQLDEKLLLLGEKITDNTSGKVLLVDITQKKAAELTDYNGQFFLPLPDKKSFIFSSRETNSQSKLIKFDFSSRRKTEILPIIIKTAVAIDNDNLIIVGGNDKEQLWQINLSNKEKKLLIKQEELRPDNLMLSSDNKTLYFTSDDFLYEIEL